MATIVIKLKTGSNAPTTGQLQLGEAALDKLNKVLYIGGEGGEIIKISDPSEITNILSEIARVETDYKAADTAITTAYKAADAALSARIDAIDTDISGGVVTITSDQTITGTKTFQSIMAPTKEAGDNSTSAATTAFVTAAGAAITTAYKAADAALSGRIDNINTTLSDVVNKSTSQTIGGIKTFYNSPLVPTLPSTDISTKAASTEFVNSVVTELAINVGNNPINFTGDVTGSGTLASGVTLSLPNTGTPSTYTKVTTDAKGRVTAGEQLTATDIPNLTIAKITDFATAVDAKIVATPLNQLAQPTGPVNLNGQIITGIPQPVDASDAATKGYVDAQSQGLAVKASVRAATTTDVGLTGLVVVDGVQLAEGDRVLVKNQPGTGPANSPDNGLYVASASAWTRTPNADSWDELVAAYVFVEEGTVNADTGWVCTVDQGGTIGETDVTWAQFSSSGDVTAADGLTKTGNELSVVGTANRIYVSAAGVDIASTYVGQASITTVGTIATGTWNGTAIDVAHGGTGLTAAINGIVKGNGTAYSAAVDGTDYMSKSATDTAIADAIAVLNGGTYQAILAQ